MAELIVKPLGEDGSVLNITPESAHECGGCVMRGSRPGNA